MAANIQDRYWCHKQTTAAGGGGGERVGGGGTPIEKKMSGVVRPASQKPYPIYDNNLRFSIPYL